MGICNKCRANPCLINKMAPLSCIKNGIECVYFTPKDNQIKESNMVTFNKHDEGYNVHSDGKFLGRLGKYNGEWYYSRSAYASSWRWEELRQIADKLEELNSEE